MTAGLTARVLSRVDGERLLTDLRHVGQSLHQVAAEERLGLVALLTWLRAQMAEDKVEVAGDRTRRLDSDAAAVQLVTIHGSKGLEYPVVYLPTLWDRFPQKPSVPLFHSDADDGAHRCIDVGNGGPALDRPRGPGGGGGRRGVAAAAVRRDDPRPLAGRGLVGAGPEEHARARRCSGCCSAARREPRVVSRRRTCTSEDDVDADPRRLAAARRPVAGGSPGSPSCPRSTCPPTNGRWPYDGSPGASTRRGGARRTPR